MRHDKKIFEIFLNFDYFIFLPFFWCKKGPDISELVEEGKQYLGDGNFDAAAEVFGEALEKDHNSCDARYGFFLAKSMQSFMLLNKTLFKEEVRNLRDTPNLAIGAFTTVLPQLDGLLQQADEGLTLVEEKNCSFILSKLPYRAGGTAETLFEGEFRGNWDVVDAYFLSEILFPGPVIDGLLYVMNGVRELIPILFSDLSTEPEELTLVLDRLRTRLENGFTLLKEGDRSNENILFWEDVDSDSAFSYQDRLKVNFFKPDSEEPVIDLTKRNLLMEPARVTTEVLNPGTNNGCDYGNFTVRTLMEGIYHGSSDSMRITTISSSVMLLKRTITRTTSRAT